MNLDTNKLSSAVRLALTLGAVAAAGVAGTAIAQDSGTTANPPADKNAKQLQTIVVTGSRIRRVDIETANPVFTIGRQEITQSGKLTMGDLIQQLPANTGPSNNPTVNNGGSAGGSYISLRGLGSARTLVLVDGHRIANNDLNQIPPELVERVEVLTDGASATYGSDAIAGVVNFILRKNFQGAEFSANYGTSDNGDGTRKGYSALFGETGDKGSIMAGFDYNKFDGIPAANRLYSANAANLKAKTNGNCSPYKGYFLCPAGSAASPQGILVWNPTLAPSATTLLVLNKGVAGTPNINTDYHPYGSQSYDTYNYQPVNLIETPQERTSVFALGNYQLTDNVDAYFHFWHNQTNASSVLAPEPVDLANAGITVLANSPINPTGVDVGAPYVATSAQAAAQSCGSGSMFSGNAQSGYCIPLSDLAYRSLGTGLRIYNYGTTTDQMVAGLRGGIGDTSWQWSSTLDYGHVATTQTAYGFVNTGKLQNSGDLAAGCQATNSCINIFNPQDPSTIAAMQPFVINGNLINSIYTQRMASADVNGNLFDLPAGSVSLAAGASYRKEYYNNYPDPIDIPPSLTQSCDANQLCTPKTTGGFNVKEAYMEVLIPILKDQPFAKSLNVDIGSRYSKYSSFGNTTNSKFQVEWRPIDDLLVRGTVAQVFRAPTITNLYGGAAPSYPGFVDPCAGTGAIGHAGACPGAPQTGTFPGGNPSTSPSGQIPATNIGALAAKAYGVNVPALQPEKGESFDYGFVYDPSWVPGLSMNVDLWRVILHDQITLAAAQTSAAVCYASNDPANPYCQLIQRSPASGFISVIYQPWVNLGNLYTSGVDFGARYRFPMTRFGNFVASFQTTYLSQFNNEVAPGLPGDFTWNYAGHYDPINHVSYPRWRGLGTLDWNMGPWQATYTVQWVGPQTVGWKQPTEQVTVVSGLPASTQFSVGNYFNQSISVGYNIQPINTLIQVGVNNFTNHQPPLFGANNALNANTDPTTYDIIGRYYWTRATVKF